MRRSVLVLLTSVLAGACQTTATECRRYIREQNACARELGDAAVIGALSADVVCAALGLPGVSSEDLRDEYACLADAYAAADCSSDEALAETLSVATCGEDVDTDQ